MTPSGQPAGPGSSVDDDEPKTEQGETAMVLRDDSGPLGWVIYGLAIVVAAMHIYLNVWGTMAELRFAGLHFASFAMLATLIYPMVHSRSAGTRTLVLGIDVVLGLLAIACVIYLFLYEDALYQRGVRFDTWDWVVTITAILVAMEMTRRTTGWLIPCLVVISFTYVVWWGQYLGGVFQFPGLTLETMLFRSFFGSDGMFGPISRISFSYVTMFILFGAFLLRSGAGDFIIDLARCAAGRFIGGPGLVAVLGSGMMGSISGSAVANTVSTGVITIPLMRKAGYKPKFAAGVEAAASTGGQLMPPIMGAGAFVMQNLTQISYLTIIGVSVLPAMLYFLSVAFYVRIEAKRLGLQPLDADGEETPRLRTVLAGGWHFLLPIVVLVWLLIDGFTPTYAAGIATVSVVVASWLSRNRMGLRAVLDALVLGARNTAALAVLLVTVGLVVNVLSTTGIGNTFSIMIQDWAGGSLAVTLLLVALASLVLGMGLPVTAAYIILATLSAPAIKDLMVNAQFVDLIVAGDLPEQARMLVGALLPEVGQALAGPMSPAEAQAILAQLPPDFVGTLVEQSLSAEVLMYTLLSAHLIIFWLSQDSNVTPPVCLCSFAAASIAGSKPMATGFESWKIAKGLYIVPFLFAYTNFIGGPPLEVLEIFIFAIFGVYAFAGVFQGGLEGPVGWISRGLLAVATALLLWPHGALMVHLAGVALVVVLVVLSRIGKAP